MSPVELRLAGPVMVASGCGGAGPELAAYTDLTALGGFVTRTISLEARSGGDAPRIVETPSGLVNAIGLQNPGLDQFLARELPWLHRHRVRVFVSVAGRTLAEYAELARRLAVAPGVSGIEVNLSAPDPGGAGTYDAREPFHAGSAVAAVRRETPRGVPVLAKLRSDVVRAVETARAVAEAGADGAVLGNALPAAMPDGRAAGLSGPAIGPLALRCVAQVRAELPELPVIGCGGIATPADLRAFLDAGAVAVQVGTAQLHDPSTLTRLVAAGEEER